MDMDGGRWGGKERQSLSFPQDHFPHLCPKTIAKDSESKHEGASKLQWALDTHMVADLQVQEAVQEEESLHLKNEQEVVRKAEAQEAARVEAEEITRKEEIMSKEESWRMN